MIELKKMTTEDYKNYISVAIKDYAQDKITAGTWTCEDAFELAKESIESLLPAGKETKKHYLFSIVEKSANKKVGFLWVHLKDSKLFIYDFIIFEAFRNLGYGKKTLVCLDYLAKEMNALQIDLHVFAHNKGAIHLYEKVGFVATDISMSKQLK
ncbi:GNAT family N-acetyltransferase [Candidatus Enterococcus mansonii]|uniref:N-acetyltransferase domain-containing protein n=1 Tax=Candidatus Enterococcus mansonii TaxID=1834181 RepID=A0A242CKM4_9ENTE|nr:GNAT family N-acetyltransferase [Enterococcus sp. 4G2_DIV0659]OTO10470.1 hypothetical protein A5880_001154 [Enterococcus sp. 4G2_DIV0659]